MATFRRIFAFVYVIFFVAMMIYTDGNADRSTAHIEMDVFKSFSIATFLALFVTQIPVYSSWLLGDRTHLWQIYYLVSATGFCLVTLLVGSNPWGHFLTFFLMGLSPLAVAGEMIYTWYRLEPKK